MSDELKRALLATEIGSALHRTAIGKRASRLFGHPVSKQLLLMAIALAAIHPGAARSLTIGDLQVHSSLGQPFVASTTARIAPGEALAPNCVGAIADMPGGNISPVQLRTTVAETSAPGEYPVRITSTAPMHEPMYEIQLKVSCPGILSLAKNYVVMLNVGMPNAVVQPVRRPSEQPKTAETTGTTATMATKTQVVPVEQDTAPNMPALPAQVSRLGNKSPDSADAVLAAPPRFTARLPIPAGSKYRVQSGDALSIIAARVEDKSELGAENLAKRILQENPSAFIGGDPDMIKLGFLLSIPNERAPAGNSELASRATGSPAPAAEDVSAAAATSLPSGETRAATAALEKTAAADDVGQQPSAAAAPEAVLANAQATQSEPDESSRSGAGAPETAFAAAGSGNEPSAGSGGGNTPDGTPENPKVNEVTTSTATTSVATVAAEYTAASVSTSTPQTARATGAQAPVALPPESNRLLASGSGLMVGALLAALILGRGLIAGWLPGRLKRSVHEENKLSEHADTMINTDAGLAGIPSPETALLSDQTVAEPVEDSIEMPADAAESTAAAAARDLSLNAPAERALEQPKANDSSSSPVEPVSAAPELAATNVDAMAANETPRISLRDAVNPNSALDFDLSDMEEPRENTRRYSDPSMLAEDKLADEVITADTTEEPDSNSTMRTLFDVPEDSVKDEAGADITGTMHDIFHDAPGGVSNHFETEEITDLSNRLGDNNFAQVDIDNTSSLQSLSETVCSGGADDELSKTLTQALGLLEQDYEDELTNSQILEQKDIQKAFAAQAQKDN